jgi:Fe2+ or Zn2+ uptake regulation protein
MRDTEKRSGENLTPLEAAVLDLLISSDRPLTVDEIAEKLSSDYDEPPTHASVLKMHFSRRGHRTDGNPADS